MKSTAKWYFLLFSTIIAMGLIGCSDDDDVSNSGTLSMSFTNSSSDVRVSIYDIQNATMEIYTASMNGAKELTITLNVGNYLIQPYSSSNAFFPKAGFQIQGNKKTQILYDANNNVTVKNE